MFHHFEIGICGLHYHPSNPFFFHSFFHILPLEIFIHLVYVLFINPAMDLFY